MDPEPKLWVPEPGDEVYAVGGDGYIYKTEYNYALHPIFLFPTSEFAAELALGVIAFRDKHNLMLMDPKSEKALEEYRAREEEKRKREEEKRIGDNGTD